MFFLYSYLEMFDLCGASPTVSGKKRRADAEKQLPENIPITDVLKKNNGTGHQTDSSPQNCDSNANLISHCRIGLSPQPSSASAPFAASALREPFMKTVTVC